MGLLSLQNASLRFGGIVALDDVSLEAEEGTIFGLIGPNGAGKTTAFNVITRLYRLDSGDVVFDDRSLLHTPPSRVVQPRHRAHVPERRALPDDDGARERPRRRAHGFALPAGARRARDGAGDARLRRYRRRRATGRAAAAVRNAQARRARARARLEAAAAAARRARGRPQPRGGRRARDVHPGAPRRPEAHRAARRAPHEPRHARLRPRARPQLRPHDRERAARGRAARPAP